MKFAGRPRRPKRTRSGSSCCSSALPGTHVRASPMSLQRAPCLCAVVGVDHKSCMTYVQRYQLFVFDEGKERVAGELVFTRRELKALKEEHRQRTNVSRHRDADTSAHDIAPFSPLSQRSRQSPRRAASLSTVGPMELDSPDDMPASGARQSPQRKSRQMHDVEKKMRDMAVHALKEGRLDQDQILRSVLGKFDRRCVERTGEICMLAGGAADGLHAHDFVWLDYGGKCGYQHQQQRY